MNKKKRIAMGVGAGVILVLLLIVIIAVYVHKEQDTPVKPGDYVELDTSNIESLDDKAVLSENPVMQAPEAVKEMKPIVEAVIAAVDKTSVEAYQKKEAGFLNYAMAYYAAMQSEKEDIQLRKTDADAVAQSMFTEAVKFADKLDDTFSAKEDVYVLNKFEQSVTVNAYDYEKTDSGYNFFVEVMDSANYNTKATWMVNVTSSENTKFAYQVSELVKLSDEAETVSDNEASEKEVSFGEELLDIVTAKDMERLASVVEYPVIVNGKKIADKDSFLALGSDGIFTEELVQALKQTDAENLIFSEGCVMLGEGTYNIWYKEKSTGIFVIGINN